MSSPTERRVIPRPRPCSPSGRGLPGSPARPDCRLSGLDARRLRRDALRARPGVADERSIDDATDRRWGPARARSRGDVGIRRRDAGRGVVSAMSRTAWSAIASDASRPTWPISSPRPRWCSSTDSRANRWSCSRSDRSSRSSARDASAGSAGGVVDGHSRDARPRDALMGCVLDFARRPFRRNGR